MTTDTTKEDRPQGLVGFSGYRWLQYHAEIAGLHQLCFAEQVRSYLEIGAHHGDTWHSVGLTLPIGSRMVAVDWPGKTAGGFINSGESLERAALDLRKKRGHETHIHLGDSNQQDIIDQVAKLGPFDLVFIDGDHSYAGCLADWKNYGTLGRVVAFHDINQVARPRSCQVHKVYAELCATHRHKEISAGYSNRGIGVIWRC